MSLCLSMLHVLCAMYALGVPHDCVFAASYKTDYPPGHYLRKHSPQVRFAGKPNPKKPDDIPGPGV